MEIFRMYPIITGEWRIAPGGYYINTDPFGSYTGRPKDPDDKPVQDADDL